MRSSSLNKFGNQPAGSWWHPVDIQWSMHHPVLLPVAYWTAVFIIWHIVHTCTVLHIKWAIIETRSRKTHAVLKTVCHRRQTSSGLLMPHDVQKQCDVLAAAAAAVLVTLVFTQHSRSTLPDIARHSHQYTAEELCHFCHESSGGWRKNEDRPLAVVSASVPFYALTLFVWWEKGHMTYKMTCATYP